MGGCDTGETEIVQDTNHKEKRGDQTCTGGMQSYCCKGFKPAPNGPDLVKDAAELAKSVAESVAAQVRNLQPREDNQTNDAEDSS